MYAYYNNNINDFTILSLSLYSNNSIPLAVVQVLRIRQVKHLNAACLHRNLQLLAKVNIPITTREDHLRSYSDFSQDICQI